MGWFLFCGWWLSGFFLGAIGIVWGGMYMLGQFLAVGVQIGMCFLAAYVLLLGLRWPWSVWWVSLALDGARWLCRSRGMLVAILAAPLLAVLVSPILALWWLWLLTTCGFLVLIVPSCYTDDRR